LLAHDIANPLRTRQDGLIDMNTLGRLAWGVRRAIGDAFLTAAKCVVEHHDARCASYVLH